MVVKRLNRKRAVMKRPRNVRRFVRKSFRRVPRLVKQSEHYLKRAVNLHTVWQAQGSTNQTDGLSLAATTMGQFTSNDGWFYNVIPAGTTSYASLGYAFQLAHLVNYTEFTNLFDQYQIAGLRLEICPAYNTSDNPTNNPVWNGTAITFGQSYSVSVPVIHTVVDFDDASVYNATELGVNNMREFWSYRCKRIDGKNKIAKRYCRPRVLSTNIMAGGATSAGADSAKRWITGAGNQVSHYGFKAILETLNPTTAEMTVYYKIIVTAYMKWRGTK